MSDERLRFWGEKLSRKLARGIPQQQNLLEFCRAVVSERIERNGDAIIAITGSKGKGKSSLSLNLTMLFITFGMEYQESHMVHGLSDMPEVVRKMTRTKKCVFIFDEIIKMAYGREAMTSTNRKLNQIFTIARKMNHIIILNLPYFRPLDSGIRNNNVNFWFHVFAKSQDKKRDRGFAIAAFFTKNLNMNSSDPWGLDDKKLVKRQVFSSHMLFDKVIKRMPCYRKLIRFPPLPITIEEKYVESSESAIAEFGDDWIEEIKGGKKPKTAAPAEHADELTGS